MSLEAHIYLSSEMEQPESVELLGGEVVVYSARSPQRSTDNEDAAAIVPEGPRSGVLIVADGMGGAAGGQQASQIAVETIAAETLRASDSDDVARTVILNGIEAANEKVMELGIGAASTLAAVEIQDGTVRPYHVGDSTILVVGQRGKIKLRTIEHSPVSMAVEAGVIDDREAMSHEDRHLVSNIVGASDMRIEIGPTLKLSPFDTVLLASDGLFDNLTTDEIIQRIRKGPLLGAVSRLVVDAQTRMNHPKEGLPSKPDDLTVVAYRLGKK